MKKLFTIILWLFAIPLFAAHYYVKNGGNNALSGLDDANAWATIAKVNATSFAPDDIISFKCGSTWTEIIDLGLSPSTSGTSSHPILFNSYSTGDNPKIMTTGRFSMYYENKNYLSFEDITFDGTNFVSGSDGGEIVKLCGGSGSTHTSFTRCIFQNGGHSGLLVINPSDYTYIGYCEFMYNGDNPGDHGMYISSAHNTIEYNNCHHNEGEGINFNTESVPSVHDNIVRYNYSHHNTGGIVVNGGSGNQFYYNICAYNTSRAFRYGMQMVLWLIIILSLLLRLILMVSF